jgi:hypothetical protein
LFILLQKKEEEGEVSPKHQSQNVNKKQFGEGANASNELVCNNWNIGSK